MIFFLTDLQDIKEHMPGFLEVKVIILLIFRHKNTFRLFSILKLQNFLWYFKDLLNALLIHFLFNLIILETISCIEQMH